MNFRFIIADAITFLLKEALTRAHDPGVHEQAKSHIATIAGAVAPVAAVALKDVIDAKASPEVAAESDALIAEALEDGGEIVEVETAEKPAPHLPSLADLMRSLPKVETSFIPPSSFVRPPLPAVAQTPIVPVAPSAPLPPSKDPSIVAQIIKDTGVTTETRPLA